MNCTDLEWNPISSAQSHSALAGVLAGLVFAGIVVLFSDRNPNRSRTRALVFFSGALLALALDSFIFGVIAGEQVCAKAWTETMPAAGLLGLGALGIFGGISWLFNAYDDDHGRVTRLANLLTYTTALIVAYHLKVTAASYLIDMQTSTLYTPPTWLFRLVDGYALLIAVIIFLFPLSRWLRRRLTLPARLRTVAQKSPTTGTTRSADDTLDRAAIQAAYLSVVYVIAVAITSGTLLSRPRGGWEPVTPGYVAALSTILSLAIPTLALLAQLRALPSDAPTPSTRTEERTPESARPHGRHNPGSAGAPDAVTAQGGILASAHAAGLDAVTGQVGRSRLRQRQDSYLVNHYVGLHITAVSIALGIAGVTAANLLAYRDIPMQYHVLFGVLWLASLLAVIAAFAGAVVGSFALPGLIPSMWDLFLPLLIALAEFLLFVILTPPVVGLTQERAAVRSWFLVLGGFALLAAAAITRARSLFSGPGYAGADIAWYVSRLRADTRGAGITACLGLAGGVFGFVVPDAPVWVAYGFASAIVVCLLVAVVRHGRTAQRWRVALAHG
ncbi:hypothetical protein [Planosporangium mesophilum]|uniref:Uncharacterized protein n=1 Tax=Planosporangium mesophilum TaxID=689768 RepID=A0A8J3TDY4_9ACTN|nr:hypothetical protein [Planosporangium mesophilum]NJC86588.1 hypothetical protein [Planosporangium mesophilum]GII25375.1 hypothetical protein Pme01_49720 [Planosporangium mesophilum]